MVVGIDVYHDPSRVRSSVGGKSCFRNILAKLPQVFTVLDFFICTYLPKGAQIFFFWSTNQQILGLIPLSQYRKVGQSANCKSAKFSPQEGGGETSLLKVWSRSAVFMAKTRKIRPLIRSADFFHLLKILIRSF
jgi:hypothetical protein